MSVSERLTNMEGQVENLSYGRDYVPLHNATRNPTPQSFLSGSNQ